MRNKFAHYINPKDEELKTHIGKNHFPLFYIENGCLKKDEFPLEEIEKRFSD